MVGESWSVRAGNVARGRCSARRSSCSRDASPPPRTSIMHTHTNRHADKDTHARVRGAKRVPCLRHELGLVGCDGASRVRLFMDCHLSQCTRISYHLRHTKNLYRIPQYAIRNKYGRKGIISL